MKNVKIRLNLNNCNEYLCINVKDICPCEDVVISENIVKCSNMPTKVCSELLLGEDVIGTACIVI